MSKIIKNCLQCGKRVVEAPNTLCGVCSAKNEREEKKMASCTKCGISDVPLTNMGTGKVCRNCLLTNQGMKELYDNVAKLLDKEKTLTSTEVARKLELDPSWASAGIGMLFRVGLLERRKGKGKKGYVYYMPGVDVAKRVLPGTPDKSETISLVSKNKDVKKLNKRIMELEEDLILENERYDKLKEIMDGWMALMADYVVETELKGHKEFSLNLVDLFKLRK